MSFEVILMATKLRLLEARIYGGWSQGQGVDPSVARRPGDQLG